MSATPNEAITDWVEASPVFLDEKEGAQDMMLKRLMIEIDIIDRFIESHMHANWNLDLAQKTADHHSSQEYCKIVDAEQEQAFLPNDYDLEVASRSYLEIAQSVNVELKKRSTQRTGSDKLGKILGGSMSPRLADRSAV